jgi:hypothetical protein
MTFLDLHFTCPPDPEEARRIKENVTRTYLSMLPPRPLRNMDTGAIVISTEERIAAHDTPLERYDAKQSVDTILLVNLPGRTETGELIVRVVGVDESHPLQGNHAAIKASFSDAARAVVSTCPISFLPKFLKFLFAPAIPKDPELAADMELGFTHLRRFTSIGQLYIPASEIIVQEQPSQTNNSDADSTGDSQNEGSGGKKCRICGAPIVHSERIYLSDTFRHPHNH